MGWYCIQLAAGALHCEDLEVTNSSAPIMTFPRKRRYGIGGDGVIFALPGKDGLDYSMRIINSDGTEVRLGDS